MTAFNDVLIYDPEEGVLTWKVSRGRVAKGQRAGAAHNQGYRQVRVAGENFLEHRVIWKMQTGEWPPEDKVIDHINGDKADNRWANLRLLSQARNVGRAQKPRGDLPRGVWLDQRRGTYNVNIGLKPYRWTRSGLTLKEATALAAEWIQIRYGDNLESSVAA